MTLPRYTAGLLSEKIEGLPYSMKYKKSQNVRVVPQIQRCP
jgi:hypothetical protein